MSFMACVLTVSDTCDVDHSKDTSGPLLTSRLTGKGFDMIETAIVADDVLRIQGKLCEWSDRALGVDLIVTTGGTGFTARDVTPEATKAIVDRDAPGIAHALISGSLKATPMAMLSRLSAGIRKRTLIINFPGSAKACDECLAIVEPVLSHAIHQLRGDTTATASAHKQLQQPLRSKVQLQSVGLRPRHSQYPMISMDTAINRIIGECVAITDVEYIDLDCLDQLMGRLLADSICAAVPLPPFRASIKDGYAVVAADGSGDRKVLAKAATAGGQVPMESIELTSGCCMRVSTGAPLPAGCDAVVQVEDTKVVQLSESGEELVICIENVPKVGQDIRPVGCDIPCDGKPIVNRFTQLGPIELGLLASIGIHTRIPVFRRPVVAVLSTGDEIGNVGQTLGPYQVWDSNRPILMSLLRQNGVQSMDLGIAVDDVNDVFGRMRRGLLAADVLITSGGVSMGERDLLKHVMEVDFGAQIHFGRVNVKPGKPVTFATVSIDGRKKYIFGLPGNPVSAFVTFNLFVKPLLDCLSNKDTVNGLADIKTYQRCQRVRLECDEKVYRLDDRPEFARAVVSFGTTGLEAGFPTARLTGNQRSSRLLSAKDANALVLLPQKSDSVDKISCGDFVTAFLI
ncbi:unnamed protein product [Medioppia subpectinata]|uniref:MoaB/Mog domain-containing protein n=1 Tax=Medioppia subpectinata TaxID=1979941 RepID=A0A7R9PZJ8_9ACAR|nr:unnamed protein product [Medioppia subpectinata]CAG2107027.1 unnamed protein product [Medioppia subpectinata]